MLNVYIKSKENIIKDIINSICLSCFASEDSCKTCVISDSYDDFIISKEVKSYVENEKEVQFEKNFILISQNRIEEICSECTFIGSSCRECNLHKLKRNLASLPVLEAKNKLLFEYGNLSDSKKESGKSCGTSCSTSCGSKK